MKPTLLACWFALATAACSGAADIPATPDLRELLQDYERPSASLDGTRVATALNSAPNLKALAEGIRSAKYLLDDDINSVSKTSSGNTGSGLRLQGSLNLHIRCRGELSDPVYDDALNGYISLTVAVAENRILRSMGGEAKACVLRGAIQGLTTRIEIDGPVAFDIGGDVGLGQYWTGELLASIQGELRVGDYVFRNISARFKDGRFQHLVGVDGGNIVFELSGDDGITIRDGAGIWFCKAGESCARP